jgi:hypothetical protein
MEPISPSVRRSARRNTDRSVSAVRSPNPNSVAAASRGPRLRLPGSDRRVREPDGQATALSKSCIVGSRVRRPVPLLWDVATLGIGFERHDTRPGR